MDKATISKLHYLEVLQNSAKDLVVGGAPNIDSIKYLYNFDEEFCNDFTELWIKYRSKYNKLIEEL